MFQIEWYIDLCPWKGKTSVRWSRNDKMKNRQNDQKLTLTASRHPNQTDPPPKHIEYLQHSIKKDVNQPNGTNNQHSLIEWQSTTRTVERAKMDRFFWFFSTVIQRHYGNTTTTITLFIEFLMNSAKESKEKMVRPWRKSKKGSARLSPVDAPSQAKDPSLFLYEYSAKSNPRTTDTCVIAIRF